MNEDSFLDSYWESQQEYLDYQMEHAEMNAREAADYDYESETMHNDYEEYESYDNHLDEAFSP